MIRTLESSVVSGTLVAFMAVTLGAQTPSPAISNSNQSALPPVAVFSIGQPPIWRQQISLQGTALSHGNHSGATVTYGVFHSLNKPPIQSFNHFLGLIGGTV